MAKSLEATISKTGIEALQRSSTEVSEAYDVYLKDRAHYRRWNRQDNETALAFYQQAAVLDPDFSLAHAGITNTYALRAAMIDEFERATLVIINNGHEAWSYRWNMAFVEALRGNIEQALDWYEQTVDAGRRRIEWDEQESGFASLRDEPRFQAALEKQRQLRGEMRARVNVMLNEQ